MEKLKENYQFVIGFVALIISLSAFKEELEGIVLILSVGTYNLAQLFFWLIIGYLIVIQFYVIPFVFLTKFPDSKFLKFTGSTSYVLFVMLSLTPLGMAVFVLLDWFFGLFNTSEIYTELVGSGIALLLGVISGWFSQGVVAKYKREKQQSAINSLEAEESVELEKAKRLFEDKYYSHSILELFKTVETRIHLLLIESGIEIQRRSPLELIRVAEKQKLLTQEQLISINELRNVRNLVAHEINFQVTKEEAKKFLDKVVSIINELNSTLKNKDEEK